MAKKASKKPAEKHGGRPRLLKILTLLYVVYLIFPVMFFISLLAGTIKPVEFGTLSMAFSFLVVAFLFVLYFGLWKMRKWGLYFAVFMSFLVLMDWSTRTMVTTFTVELNANFLAVLAYHVTSIALILLTFYTVFTQKRKFN